MDSVIKNFSKVEEGVNKILQKVNILKEYLDESEFVLDILVLDKFQRRITLQNAVVDTDNRLVIGDSEFFSGAKILIPFSEVKGGDIIHEVTKSGMGGG